MNRNSRTWVAVALALLLVAGVAVLIRTTDTINRTNVVGYFENSNGIYVGDDVRILGVNVGRIDKIEPQPDRVKISFWYDSKYKVPADANAAILSPTLVTSRAIQLTPVFTGGPVMADNAVIPRERTVVPVEWDTLRQQLERLAVQLQPTEPGGVSPLGSIINTTADNLRGQGANIRDTVIKLSQAFSALGDHSTDIFSTVKNLSILVSALQDSTTLMRQLNQNLASVTGVLADNPDEIGDAVRDLNDVVGEVQSFVAENRESLGTTSDKLAGVTQALTDSLDDVKQFLHVAPNTHPELREHLPTGPGRGERHPGCQQLRRPDHLPMRCGAGGVAAGRRAVGEAVRAVPGADHQEPPVQLPAPRPEPLRRCHGAAERDHLQRGMDAARLHSAATAAGHSAAGSSRRWATAAPAAPPLAAEAPMATNPADGLQGLMVPPGVGP